MKKLTTILLAAALLASLAIPSVAAHVSAAEALSTLETLQLVEGGENGLEPERAATRAEAVVMLLRLLGQYQAAEAMMAPSPFEDAGWADRYLGYAYAKGLVDGVADAWFGSNTAVSARDYVTMALRALGYREGADFTWADSLAFSDRIGLTHGEYAGDAGFLREDMVLISYTALTLKLKDSETRLIDSLYAAGAVSADALKATRFADAVNAGRNTYSAAEIHELVSSSVLFIEAFASQEDLENGDRFSSGSGFLISPDGVALLCWHELEDASAVLASTTDGRSFPVTRVLYYDVFQDIAVVRLSMTDTDGNAVRFFPYLDLGDSDAISAGELAYLIGSPLGMTDTITSGLISYPKRIVDDPAYPLIQMTTPASSGSSGGPLMNRYGEVIGLLFGGFVGGENMNLAVPINVIENISLTGPGVALEEIAAEIQERKDNAVLTIEPAQITLAPDEKQEAVIFSDYPGTMSVRFKIDDTDVVSCKWGDLLTKQTVALYLTGGNPGATKVHITYANDGNPEAEAVIEVTVAEGAEEAGETEA